MDRKDAYQRLLAEDPEAADWLKAMAEEFGKPEAITITFSNGDTFCHGEFSSPQDSNTAPRSAEYEIWDTAPIRVSRTG